MTHEERETLIAQNIASRDALQAEIDARHARQLAGIEDFDNEIIEPQRIVRKTYEQPEPNAATLDAATQARWDAWCDSRIAVALAERDEFHRQMMAQVIAEERQRARSYVQEQLGLLRADIEVRAKACRSARVELSR